MTRCVKDLYPIEKSAGIQLLMPRLIPDIRSTTVSPPCLQFTTLFRIKYRDNFFVILVLQNIRRQLENRGYNRYINTREFVVDLGNFLLDNVCWSITGCGGSLAPINNIPLIGKTKSHAVCHAADPLAFNTIYLNYCWSLRLGKSISLNISWQLLSIIHNWKSIKAVDLSVVDDGELH